MDLPDLDELVELGDGTTKRLGYCTRADLEAAAEHLSRLAVRDDAASAVERGASPVCDWQTSPGVFCERPADYLSVAASPSAGRALCADHHAQMLGRKSARVGTRLAGEECP